MKAGPGPSVPRHLLVATSATDDASRPGDDGERPTGRAEQIPCRAAQDACGPAEAGLGPANAKTGSRRACASGAAGGCLLWLLPIGFLLLIIAIAVAKGLRGEGFMQRFIQRYAHA